MNLKAEAHQACEMVALYIKSHDEEIYIQGFIDIKEAERLKDDLIAALQLYDEYMALQHKAANEFMEEGK